MLFLVIVVFLIGFIVYVLVNYVIWKSDQRILLEQIERHLVALTDIPTQWLTNAKTVLRDVQGRLHNENGPAVINESGQVYFYWHGTSVPSEWIERPGFVTPFLALTESNLERRRAACDIVGWDKILDQLHPSVIDADIDPEIGTLVEVFLPGIATAQRFLRVRCGTGRSFTLVVPPEVSTALEANAWTYGIDSTTYQPEVRT